MTEKIISRDNLRNCDALMLFDYPADRELFDKILSETNPKAIHFMNYDIKYFDEKEFLKTCVGMLKFAHNNNAGKVELKRCSSFLGKPVRVFELLFDMFEDIGLIKITEKHPDFYRIEFLGNAEISKVLHETQYNEMIDLIDESEAFQKNLLEDELTNLALSAV